MFFTFILFLALIINSPGNDLKQKIEDLEKQSGGILGVAAVNLQNGQQFRNNADHLLPMASTYKFPIGIRVLQEVETGNLNLEDSVLVGLADRRWGWSPITKEINQKGPRYFTYAELLERMIGYSDNTASDVLLSTVGGPEAVTKMLRENGIERINVNRPEHFIHADIYQVPRSSLKDLTYEAFLKELEETQPAKLQKGFEAFLKDERDMATPEAFVQLMQKFLDHQFLNKKNTKVLFDLMVAAPVRNSLIKAGVPEGAIVGHKSGGVFDVNGINGGENDIGIIYLPGAKKPILLAILTSRTKISGKERQELIAGITEMVINELK